MKNRKRNRLKNYDYSKDNLYFVTICVHNRLCCFGSVNSIGTGRDLSVHHSNENHSNENHSNENHSNEKIKMELNKYGLIVQEKMNWLMDQYEYVDIHNYVIMPNHIHLILEIDRLRVIGKEIKIKSLSGLIGALKTTTSKLIHLEGFLDFAWQRSFYDHIISDEKAYSNISNYIDNNPEKWSVDTLHEKV